MRFSRLGLMFRWLSWSGGQLFHICTIFYGRASQYTWYTKTTQVYWIFFTSTVLTKLTRFLSFLNRNKVAYYNTVKAKQIFEIPNLPNRPFQIIVLICTVFPSITRIQCTFSTVCVFIEVTVIFSCQLERVRCWPNWYHGLLECESPAKRSGCQKIITTTCLR